MTADPNNLLSNIHEILPNTKEEALTTRGKYAYYHYCCDDIDDRGWGCGYRTLQTLCSWAYFSKCNDNGTTKNNKIIVPSIREIQNALIEMNDKPEKFRKSKEWIGSFEVCLCLDYFYDIPCKIIHANPGKLFENLHEISEHFKRFGSPIMLGGNIDASSKGIFGIRLNNDISDSYLLVIDPHCPDSHKTAEALVEGGWVKWKPVSSFDLNSFYNFCLPQRKF